MKATKEMTMIFSPLYCIVLYASTWHIYTLVKIFKLY